MHSLTQLANRFKYPTYTIEAWIKAAQLQSDDQGRYSVLALVNWLDGMWGVSRHK